MKNIVLVIDNLIVGGAQTTNIRLAEAFKEEGYNVHLITLKDTVEFAIDENINLINLKYKKNYPSLINNNIYANRLKSIIIRIEKENGNISLILGSLGLTHVLMNIIGNKNFYYVLHGSTTISKLENKKGLSKLYRKYKLKKLYNNKNIICVSNGVENDIMTLNITPLSIRTIYNFFDFEKIKKLSNEIIDIELPKNYIIHVGRVAKVKRHDILIKAFHLLKDKELKLILLGDGEERDNILKLINDLNLTNRIILMGFKKNPYPFIKKAKALVLSSNHEGFGNVIVESLIVNTIAISTDCPYGPYEILSDNFKQCLTEVENPISLSKCIEKNLDNTPIINQHDLYKFEKNTIIKEYKTLFL